MSNVVIFFFLSIGLSGCSTLEFRPIIPDAPTWVESTRNCDGSNIDGPVQYTVYFDKESRGGDTSYPTSTCSEPPEDGVYSGALAMDEDQDLCEVLPAGDWYIAMTAETSGGKSNYSNEVKVRIADQEVDSGSTCQTLK